MRRLSAVLLLAATSCTANVENEPLAEDEAAVVSDTPGVAIWTRVASGPNSFDPPSSQTLTDLATDARGWAIVTGTYVGEMRLDGRTFTSSAYRAFVAALDGYGKLRWLRHVDGEYIDAARVSVDSGGNVVVNGSCSKAADFGAGAMPCPRAYLASYTGDGAFRWAKAIGANATSMSGGANRTTALVAVSSVDVDLGDGVVVPGNDPFCRMNCRYQTVLAVFDGGGKPKWWRAIDPNRGHFGAVRVDEVGIVIGGTAVGPLDLTGDYVADTNTHAGSANRAAVVARYRHDGSLAWARAWGEGEGEPSIDVLGSRADGELIAAGNFNGTIDVDGTTLTSPYTATNDILLVRLRADGTKRWAKRLGGSATGYRYVTAADIDSDGHVAVTGSFTRSIYIGGTMYAQGGDADMFLAKFTPNTGATAWKKRFDAGVSALHITPSNRILVAGEIEESRGEAWDGYVTRFYP